MYNWLMLKNRYLTSFIIEDLKDKMAFVGGPRQVGKTTLCQNLVASHFKSHAYFNWDNRTDRKAITASVWPGDAELLIFDEIHKYRQWKGLIKGEYDKLKHIYKFLVTGSARLDLYRRGGDSLQGRYHYYRLHPFTIAEIEGLACRASVQYELPIGEGFYQDSLEALDVFGGFPEPFIKQSKRQLRRWHNEKIERMFREDIMDVKVIRDIGNMKLLSDILPSKVGSLLSLNAIREDLEVSFRAVSHWMDILESFYYCFRIYPYSAKKIRSLKKEPKLYLWDWSEIEDEAARFENLIASHLLKFVHFIVDYEGYKAELYFLRDVDKREVDFLVTINGKPWFAVEAKLNDASLSPHLIYFRERLSIPYIYQVVKTDKVDKVNKGVRIISAGKFLSSFI
ncbi:MAG TPA: ATP-binding protein [Nitrospirae bacterium]|nr:ATP-binding protein [Nitrospirota bacterium]HDZ02491.1 ATP-binding protein [Nitrospirota bacterium]